MATTALARHCLVWLAPAAWQGVLEQAVVVQGYDRNVDPCLRHWAQHDLPLVVTRQAPGWTGRDARESIALGLAAPACWNRRRLTVHAKVGGIRSLGHFPEVHHVRDVMAGRPANSLASWAKLCDGLQARGATAHVYGSYGWQQLTGLHYVHAGSDIDLLLSVSSAAQADQVVRLLAQADAFLPRRDGELSFPDGSGVAWREWAAWRAGDADQVVVKRVHGPSLERVDSWQPTV